MLSSVLKSTYLQYKEDTDAVASWLATTAKACGYAVDLLVNRDENKTKPPVSGRLKGKARKAAREAAKDAGTTNSPHAPKPPTYTIAVKDFVSLAEWIVGRPKPSVQVPARFVSAINRAISVRQRHGKELSGKDEKSDKRHNFFVGILEQVRDILRPTMSRDAAELLEENVDAKATPLNRFEGLEVEEPSKELLQAPNISSGTGKQAVEEHYEAERDSRTEAFVALRLILEDCNRFRTTISESWDGYHLGIFDLVSVSLMTNTAIDLARRLEEDAAPLFNKYGGSEQLLQEYYLATCHVCGEEESAREQPDDEMNFRMYDAAETLFVPTYMLLEAFMRVVEPGHAPIMKPGYFGTYDATSDRSRKNAREKFKEDKAMLCGILPDFYLTVQGPPKTMIAEDELTRGLRDAFRTKELPLWLIFATQVYVDIHHVLRGYVSNGISDLQKTGKYLYDSIDQIFKFHASLRIENWPRSNDLVFKQLQEDIDRLVMNDPLFKRKQDMGLPPQLVGAPHQLMSSHPLRCGLHAYYLKIMHQEISIAFVNAWGSIIYTYQLYNAVRQEELIQREWQDMAILMSMQDSIFAGDSPSTFDAYLKWFSLSIGVSATVFAKDKRKSSRSTVAASKTGPRGMLKEQAPVAQMFKSRYCSDSARVDLTEQDLQKIVSKAVWKQDAESAVLAELGILSLARESKGEEPVNSPPATDPDAATAARPLRPTAVHLLESMRNTLSSERLELDFDYLLLHRMCWRLLRSVQEKCDAQLKDMFGPGYLERESQLPFVVGYIFMGATRTKRLGAMLVKKKSDVVSSKLLEQAAGVMDGYLESCGGFVARIMRELRGVEIVIEGSDAQGRG
ncbi:MAG: hypothetical protein LQ340_001140 [Diploschistes diacapsis]|nr:MAG: hypothetical protein LQ340_001140 [Diploschistes diacapsis]